MANLKEHLRREAKDQKVTLASAVLDGMPEPVIETEKPSCYGLIMLLPNICLLWQLRVVLPRFMLPNADVHRWACARKD